MPLPLLDGTLAKASPKSASEQGCKSPTSACRSGELPVALVDRRLDPRPGGAHLPQLVRCNLDGVAVAIANSITITQRWLLGGH